jgi:hypothetical protein
MPYVNTAREAKAMLTQVVRVNGQSRAAADSPLPGSASDRSGEGLGVRASADLRRQLADANARIVALERQLAEARLLIAAYEDSAPLSQVYSPFGRGVGGEGVGTYRNGKRVMTAKEAAQMMGVSLSTVSRYCDTGFWRAEQDASGRWLIDASQDLRKKRGSVGTRHASSAKSKSG